jgi:hypothetical protein
MVWYYRLMWAKMRIETLEVKDYFRVNNSLAGNIFIAAMAFAYRQGQMYVSEKRRT